MDIRKHGDYVIYQNTISMVYLKAAKDVLPDVTIEIDNSLNKGFYTLPSEPVSQDERADRRRSSYDKRRRDLQAWGSL